MKRLQIIFLALGILALQGCAAAVLTAGSLAAGTGVNHTLSGISYKTFSTPVETLRAATLNTLDRMDMEVTDIKETRSGWDIHAKAFERTIEIELEALTKKATRMRVVANMGSIFFKDSATSTEIIIQTVESLELAAIASRRSKSAPHEASQRADLK